MLPRLLVVGDSVCLRGSTMKRRSYFLRRGDPGYYPFVEKILSSSFMVYCLPELGRTSKYLLEHIDAWLIKPKYDIIHFNCGLHDIKRWSNSLNDNYSNTENIVPIEKYRKNLENIVIKLENETKSDLIWATSTPVIDERHNRQEFRIKRQKSGQDYLRYENDVTAYNEIARDIMSEWGIPTNDLHKLVENVGKENCLDYAGVHLTKYGCDIVSKAIADFIIKMCLK